MFQLLVSADLEGFLVFCVFPWTSFINCSWGSDGVLCSWSLWFFQRPFLLFPSFPRIGHPDLAGSRHLQRPQIQTLMTFQRRYPKSFIWIFNIRVYSRNFTFCGCYIFITSLCRSFQSITSFCNVSKVAATTVICFPWWENSFIVLVMFRKICSPLLTKSAVFSLLVPRSSCACIISLLPTGVTIFRICGKLQRIYFNHNFASFGTSFMMSNIIKMFNHELAGI